MIRYGYWWAFQASWDRTFSLGFHLDPRSRYTRDRIRYGPYLDLHLPGCVLSVGRNPIYAGEIDLLRSYSRGGKAA